jgi:hypothetical protein
MLAIVTVTPGKIASLVSRTVPCIVPVTVCANVGVERYGTNRTKIAVKTAHAGRTTIDALLTGGIQGVRK